MPRLHPTLGIEDLQPRLKHPNQFISEEDLLNAKLFEFERRQNLEALLEIEPLELKGNTEKEPMKENLQQMDSIGRHTNVETAEYEFKETTEGAVDAENEET